MHCRQQACDRAESRSVPKQLLVLRLRFRFGCVLLSADPILHHPSSIGKAMPRDGSSLFRSDVLAQLARERIG